MNRTYQFLFHFYLLVTVIKALPVDIKEAEDLEAANTYSYGYYPSYSYGDYWPYSYGLGYGNLYSYGYPWHGYGYGYGYHGHPHFY